MTDIKPGDTVRATRNHPSSVDYGASVTGRLTADSSAYRHYIEVPWSYAPVVLNAEMYDLELVKAAPVPVPTETGIYRDRTGGAWALVDGTAHFLDFAEEPEALPRIYAPYERIEQ